MQLQYFVADHKDQLQRVARHAVEDLWNGDATAAALACEIGSKLRLITVLAEDDLTPVICYFVSLMLEEGAITDASKIAAFEAMSTQSRRRYDSPQAREQFSGWPANWQHQMAVALDVPVFHLKKIGLGGPLLMSDLWGIPLNHVVSYFEEANREAERDDADDEHDSP